MLKLHLLYEHDQWGNPHGCSHIRMLRPFSHPSIAAQLQVSHGVDLPATAVDAVLLERSWRPGMTLDAAQKLVTAIRRMGAKFIYTLDDNLLDLHEDMPWETFPNNEQRTAFRYFAREADGLIVSTQALLDRFTSLNKKICLVPNALDERLFATNDTSSPRSKNGLIKIGYMGTRTHAADLLMILAPLREFLRKHDGKVVLELVGVFADSRMEQCFAGYPVNFLDVGDAVDYVKFIPWAAKTLHWDFALAPLRDNVFNRCKSDIKFLDYAMLGMPGIFSSVDSYSETVIHKQTGWLCANQSEAWAQALESMLTDAALRTSIAANAADYAINHRSLRQCAVQWLEAIKTIEID